MKTVGMVTLSATNRFGNSNPPISPLFRWMSRTRQGGRPRGVDARNSRADANDSTAYAANRIKRLSARRTDRPSSTMEITGWVSAVNVIFSRAPYLVAGSTAYWTLVQYLGWRAARYAHCPSVGRAAVPAGANYEPRQATGLPPRALKVTARIATPGSESAGSLAQLWRCCATGAPGAKTLGRRGPCPRTGFMLSVLCSVADVEGGGLGAEGARCSCGRPGGKAAGVRVWKVTSW
jgi:hypothetical protein